MKPDAASIYIHGSPFRSEQSPSRGVTFFGNKDSEPGKIILVHSRRYDDCGVGRCEIRIYINAPASKRGFIESFVRGVEESISNPGFESKAPGYDVKNSQLIADLDRDLVEIKRKERADKEQRNAEARDSEEQSRTVVFRIKSEDRNKLKLQFYSGDYRKVWPSSDRVYSLDDVS